MTCGASRRLSQKDSDLKWKIRLSVDAVKEALKKVNHRLSSSKQRKKAMILNYEI
jgi:hypothetical protein